MSWAWRRRLIYLSILFVIIVAPLSYWAFTTYYRPPTCFDGKMNQNEQDIDCGGICVKLCQAESIPPIVHWSRIFKVSDGLYTAGILIENPNDTARASNMRYRIKVLDKDGIPILDRDGVTAIDPKERSIIVEPQIFTNQSVASTIQFQWLGEFGWERVEPELLKIEVRDVEWRNEDIQPEISSTIYNSTLGVFEDFFVGVIVYGMDGNAIAVSETYVDRLGPNDTKPIYFTWPQAFPEGVKEVEILPQI